MNKIFAVILSLSLIIGPVPAAHASGGGGYAKQILGMANGMMGSTIIAKCKLASMQWSLMAYMAGSMIYLAAEIAGGNDQKKKQKSNADSINQAGEAAQGGDFQKATIDAQIKDEEGTLKHIQNRRKWMMAVKAVYAVATALAALELILKAPPVLKPDIGACAPNPAASKGMTRAISLAYTGIYGFAGGGGVMGAAMAVGGSLAMKTIGGFLTKTEVTTEAVDKASIPLLNTSVGRLAFFGAATALVMMIDGDLGKEEKKSKDKIADLKKLRDSLSQTPDSGIAEGSSNSDANNPAGTAGLNGNTAGSGSGAYAVKPLPTGTEVTKQCFSNTTGLMEYNSESCKSAYQFSRPKFDANLNLPTLTSGANTVADLGQAIASGDMDKANVAAGTLNSMAGRLDSIKDSLLKKANDKLKAEGKKPIDINDELKRQVGVMNDALNKSSPGSGNFDMAGFDMNGVDASLASGEGDAKAEPTQEIQTAAAPNAVALPDNALSGLTEDGLLGGADNASSSAGEEANSTETASLSDSLNNFEASEGDINPDSDVSIFKQVSNRYFLNYNKIFDKRKAIQPPMSPAPAPAN